MSDAIPVQYAAKIVVACDVCGKTGDVPWYCKTCQGSLCDTCKKSHEEIAISRRHSVVPRTGEVLRLHGPAKISEPCPVHRTKDISTYCNECQVPCCVTCLAERHKKHDFCPIEDAYLSAEMRLNNYVKQLNEEVINKLDNIVNRTKNMSEEIIQDVNSIQGDINVFRKEIKDAVDSACDIMIERANKSDLNEIIRRVETERERVNDLVSHISEMTREGKLDIIKYTPPNLASLVPDVTIPHFAHQLFIPNKDIIDLIKKKFGTLEEEERQPLKKIIKIKKITQFRTKVGAKSITAAGNDQAWVMHYKFATLDLYNDRGDLIRSLTVMKGVGVNEMVVSSSGDLIVSNRDEKVRCVSASGEVSTLIQTTPFEVCGLCISKKGEIVLCIAGIGRLGNGYVAVYSSDGRKKLREIKCPDFQGQQLITNPKHVVQNNDDFCVVENYQVVVCVSERGDLRWSYDGTEAGLKKKFAPFGICKDKHHNLLVNDFNNDCLHYINSKGNLIQAILIKQQIGVCLHGAISIDDETGKMWMVSTGGDIVLAKYVE